MTQVVIQLPDELNRFVNKSVESGDYHNADELFASVVSIFKEQIEAPLIAEEDARLAALRRDVQIGIDQLDRGEGIHNLDWDARLAERHRAFAARHLA